MTTLDWDKPIQTRDGRPARLIAKDRKHSNYPYVVLVDVGGNSEAIFTYTKEGFYGSTGGVTINDIINAPPKPVKITRYVNVYPSNQKPDGYESGNLFTTKEEAEKRAYPGAVAIAVPVTYTFTPKE